MKKQSRYQSFLATSSQKYLKYGFLVALSLSIMAFKITVPIKEKVVFNPTPIGETSQEFTINNPITIPKEIPPAIDKPKKIENPNPIIIDDFIDPKVEPIADIPITEVEIPTEIVKESEPYEGPEIWVTPPQTPPTFPGDDAGLMNYLRQLKYCTSTIDRGIEGTIFVSFVVNKKGEVTDVSLVKGIDKCVDDKAVELIKNMPNWSPGKHGNHYVNVRMTVPFSLHLE